MYQINTGHLFGDSVLNLQAGVCLQKDESLVRVCGVNQKLKGTQALVVSCAGHGKCSLVQLVAHTLCKPWAGGNFDELLVPAL